MERIPEPELMDEPTQARAYSEADFAEAHDRFVKLFRDQFPAFDRGAVLDLGCGPADVTLRFARAYPGVTVDGVDGAEAMLALGEARIAQAGVCDRVRLSRVRLPADELPAPRYDAVISNSLLHHLASAETLWETVGHVLPEGAPIFIMDLSRPASVADAQALVTRYAASAPAVLRNDFYHSLLAAYRPAEIQVQLHAAGLGHLRVEEASDRHVIVFGRR